MKTGAALQMLTPRHDPPQIEPQVRAILESLGEDPRREGLAATPARVQKSLRYLTGGYGADPAKIIGDAIYPVTYDGMVVVKDIEFFSLCEHHMLPFFGKIHVGYLPKSKVVGLSKIPRLVDAFARRLQIQERLTQQIADALQEAIDPAGVGVVCEARHFCVAMRGVQKQSSETSTSSMVGAFRGIETRNEFLSLIRGAIQ